ncbi:hypothetical protein RHSIM_RhsimUnG0113400 [Rhododendron simsii]|uniref:Uncharacterized protein n=1 Tax=Rhododendron simsii TaxID=118357 RepID=A0A834FVN1_RHOSS|nr:hypothetical protein RHSIM_RhsimUnG0113400 [Rhododendron simsii]
MACSSSSPQGLKSPNLMPLSPNLINLRRDCSFPCMCAILPCHLVSVVQSGSCVGSPQETPAAPPRTLSLSLSDRSTTTDTSLSLSTPSLALTPAATPQESNPGCSFLALPLPLPLSNHSPILTYCRSRFDTTSIVDWRDESPLEPLPFEALRVRIDGM